MRGFIKRRATRVVGVVVLTTVVVAVLFMLLDWYVAPTKPSERKDLVLALAQILGGTALLSGLYFTWRTLQINREGQITDRFTRAIDQLGATDDQGKKRPEIRIGGIYALERIARDTVQYYGPIMEILAAYIRENARLPPKEASQASLLASADKDEREAREWDGWIESWTTSAGALTVPPTDIQAILDVLRTQASSRVPSSDRISLNLTSTDLRGAMLIGSDLAEADLSGANLQRAWLSQARLKGAVLQGAHLEGAVIGESQLENPSVQLARLLGLEEPELELVIFNAVDLSPTKELRQEQLEWTIGDAGVNLPQPLEQPKMWDSGFEEQLVTVSEQMK